jgi:hypothetical protein
MRRFLKTGLPWALYGTALTSGGILVTTGNPVAAIVGVFLGCLIGYAGHWAFYRWPGIR